MSLSERLTGEVQTASASCACTQCTVTVLSVHTPEDINRAADSVRGHQHVSVRRNLNRGVDVRGHGRAEFLGRVGSVRVQVCEVYRLDLDVLLPERSSQRRGGWVVRRAGVGVTIRTVVEQYLAAIGEPGNVRAGFRITAERELIAEAIAVI